MCRKRIKDHKIISHFHVGLANRHNSVAFTGEKRMEVNQCQRLLSKWEEVGLQASSIMEVPSYDIPLDQLLP